MTRFEEIGVEFQLGSRSKQHAEANFDRSCSICCSHGMHLDCDACAIACANKTVLEAFMVLETVEVPNNIITLTVMA